MRERSRATRIALLGAVLGLSLVGTGCVAPHGPLPVGHNLPRELNMTSHPPHIIEPGDNLVLTMKSLPFPKGDYRIRELDQLKITLTGVPPRWAIDELIFVVEPTGVIRLGPELGTVRAKGMTLDEVAEEIQNRFKAPPFNLKDPVAIVTLEEGRELDPVPDAVLVRPDGTISLGSYGNIHVSGLNEQQARVAVEEHLSEFFLKPEIRLEVATENYKSFYLIVERVDGGNSVARVPLTGHDTILDVLSVIDGIPPGTNKTRMWVARPAPADAECDQVLKVNWRDIVERGRTATNYQLLPGDRLYIKSDPFLALSDRLEKIFQPIERIASFAQTMLSVEQAYQLAIQSGNLFSSGFFGFGFPGFGGFGF